MRELRANLNFIAEPLEIAPFRSVHREVQNLRRFHKTIKINHKERKERKELMANISVFFRQFPWFSLFEFSVVDIF